MFSRKGKKWITVNRDKVTRRGLPITFKYVPIFIMAIETTSDLPLSYSLIFPYLSTGCHVQDKNSLVRNGSNIRDLLDGKLSMFNVPRCKSCWTYRSSLQNASSFRLYVSRIPMVWKMLENPSRNLLYRGWRKDVFIGNVHSIKKSSRGQFSSLCCSLWWLDSRGQGYL
jgi:hypothetical protein